MNTPVRIATVQGGTIIITRRAPIQWAVLQETNTKLNFQIRLKLTIDREGRPCVNKLTI